MNGLLRTVVALLACALASGAAAAEAPQAKISLSPDGRRASLTLDVLTYNIEGVPTRHGRRNQLRQIGERLSALRAAGKGPDIVLFQEAFGDEAKNAVRAAGYPVRAWGPDHNQRRRLPREGERKGHKWRKGELGIKFVGSGLAIASVYPVRTEAKEPYSKRACAGFDCLANKGGLFARIEIPGAPEPLDVFNTHMNAQRASRVGFGRYMAAHRAQVLELKAFIDEHRDPANPALLGGDFNMRRSEPRFETFEDGQPMELVHRYCMVHHETCDVRMSWDGDAPWMDTQDLQFFESGAKVSIRPVRVEAMFDGRPDSPTLSDHDGFRVIYELSWPVG